MLILGISEDFFDSGVTICDDDHILFMSNEERYTRRKNEGGFPYQSLQSALKQTGISIKEIESVCVSGFVTPFPLFRIFPNLQKKAFDARREKKHSEGSVSLWNNITEWAVSYNPISYINPTDAMKRKLAFILKKIIQKRLPDLSKEIDIHFIEHHEAHAWGSYFCSGFDKALIVTADGMGDGLSLTVSKGEGNTITRLWKSSAKSSFGLFFENLTEVLGFVPCRDEGKLTGLSAHGDANRIQHDNPFSWNQDILLYKGPYGKKLRVWLLQLLEKYSREDLCAWSQNILEQTVCSLVKYWIKRTGLNKVTVAGGVFANVLLNQKIHELQEVEELFVYPNMGDGGLSLGAISSQFRFYPKSLPHAFWGDAYGKEETKKAIDQYKLPFKELESHQINSIIAKCLYNKRIIARFDDKMEWGPRALGNRSILCDSTMRDITEKLNIMLKRSDFMPFAPALLDEDAGHFLIGYEKARHAGEFMTCCFRSTQEMKEEHGAVVHIDGTTRAQLVKKENNPTFYEILKHYKKLSGTSVVLNTSFNMHESPIVRTPNEALQTFIESGLDYLFLNNFIVGRNQDFWNEFDGNCNQ
ncbi:MAG TPA: carbamoyltransferase C-terminal domain-containing protein [Candidatus Hydrogenedens sp.]|nr:carbamoyltransferase C-terminal domain-containing protein [Candidatus Hydrogenedens sp.]HOL18610.1 carbamoyltransferase C-terminal domain-containing protein [Candidatus Hydrogenedens sp.]